MRLHTASEAVSLARKLENDTAAFYEGLAKCGKDLETLHGFAAENRRNVTQVERAYYSVISDAIEGGFAFDIEEDDYSVKLPEDAGPRDALKAATEIESMISRFYTTAANQAQSLLADVPRVFRQIAQKRTARVEKLNTLLTSIP